ncbi:hypothetical protein E2C01_033969 [Portunus trituberculatus]|uniref:Uncharacterized protein n=1 Tax=Portunus trituberculatus TaxID=210409 RepID=A0A5B7F1K0_PORTR|nr:hypothetical protein [Portunus trituberculatus]
MSRNTMRKMNKQYQYHHHHHHHHLPLSRRQRRRQSFPMRASYSKRAGNLSAPGKQWAASSLSRPVLTAALPTLSAFHPSSTLPSRSSTSSTLSSSTTATDPPLSLSCQERVGGHPSSLGPITSIGGVGGTASFASTPRIHTPTTDFQPPYFPPPYLGTENQMTVSTTPFHPYAPRLTPAPIHPFTRSTPPATQPAGGERRDHSSDTMHIKGT